MKQVNDKIRFIIRKDIHEQKYNVPRTTHVSIWTQVYNPIWNEVSQEIRFKASKELRIRVRQKLRQELRVE